MNQSDTILFRRLTAARSAGAGVRGAVALSLRLGGTALLAWAGYLHLHLWLEGYRHIPVDGPLFLLDAIAAFGLAALLLGWPRPLAGLFAAGLLAARPAGRPTRRPATSQPPPPGRGPPRRADRP